MVRGVFTGSLIPGEWDRISRKRSQDNGYFVPGRDAFAFPENSPDGKKPARTARSPGDSRHDRLPVRPVVPPSSASRVFPAIKHLFIRIKTALFGNKGIISLLSSTVSRDSSGCGKSSGILGKIRPVQGHSGDKYRRSRSPGGGADRSDPVPRACPPLWLIFFFFCHVTGQSHRDHPADIPFRSIYRDAGKGQGRYQLSSCPGERVHLPGVVWIRIRVLRRV